LEPFTCQPDAVGALSETEAFYHELAEEWQQRLAVGVPRD
jgi:hypothetical protein